MGTLSSWVDDQGFPYEVWRDDDKALALYYQAIDDVDQARPDRVTRLLDADGDLLLAYPNVRVATHPSKVLEDCQALFGTD